MIGERKKKFVTSIVPRKRGFPSSGPNTSTETSLWSRSFRSESQRNPDFSQPSPLTLKESCALRVFATWSVFGAIKKSYRHCCACLQTCFCIFMHSHVECCYTLLWANNANDNNGRVHLAFPSWNTANSKAPSSSFRGKWNAPKGFGLECLWNVGILNKYQKIMPFSVVFILLHHLPRVDK